MGTINGGGNGTDRVNDIEYFTVETLGNSQDFGDLTAATRRPGACVLVYEHWLVVVMMDLQGANTIDFYYFCINRQMLQILVI